MSAVGPLCAAKENDFAPSNVPVLVKKYRVSHFRIAAIDAGYVASCSVVMAVTLTGC